MASAVTIYAYDCKKWTLTNRYRVHSLKRFWIIDVLNFIAIYELLFDFNFNTYPWQYNLNFFFYKKEDIFSLDKFEITIGKSIYLLCEGITFKLIFLVIKSYLHILREY